MSDTDQPGTAAEEQGIVDQQAAALEEIQSSEQPEPSGEGQAGAAEPGGKVDPMEGEAPTG